MVIGPRTSCPAQSYWPVPSAKDEAVEEAIYVNQ